MLSSEWVKCAPDDPTKFIGKEMCSFEALDAETGGKPGAQRPGEIAVLVSPVSFKELRFTS